MSKWRDRRRTIAGKLHKYLTKCSKIMSLPRGLKNPYDSRELTSDEAMVMSALQAKDPQAVWDLMAKHGVDDPLDLLDLLPDRRRRPRKWKRFISLLRRIEGTSVSNPARRKSRPRRNRIRIQYRYRD